MLLNSQVFHGPSLTLHLNVTVTLALNVSPALQLLKTCALAVTCGGGGRVGGVIGGGLIVKRSFTNLFVCGLLSNRAVTCI